LVSCPVTWEQGLGMVSLSSDEEGAEVGSLPLRAFEKGAGAVGE